MLILDETGIFNQSEHIWKLADVQPGEIFVMAESINNDQVGFLCKNRVFVLLSHGASRATCVSLGASFGDSDKTLVNIPATAKVRQLYLT